MEEENIIGSFYLRLTDTGNLVGEYTNNKNTGIFTESAIRNDNTNPANQFLGQYTSTWLEARNAVAITSIMQIDHIPNSNARKFRITWRLLGNNELTFEGEGFLVNGILIGHYTDLVQGR